MSEGVDDLTFPITGVADADRLLATNPFALVVGMLLDQQVSMEWAFIGPLHLRARLGGELSASEVAARSEDAVVELFVTRPALHRYPAVMARRVHALARVIVEDYGGDTAAIWTTAASGTELRRRLLALPGYGNEKSQIFVALLAKRFGIRPDGWREAAGPFGDDTPRSAADVDSPAALATVRAVKQAKKALGQTKAD